MPLRWQTVHKEFKQLMMESVPEMSHVHEYEGLGQYGYVWIVAFGHDMHGLFILYVCPNLLIN